MRKTKICDILRYAFRIAIRYKFFVYCDIPIYRYIVTPLRTSGNRLSVMNVLAVILSITCHFFFICQIYMPGLVEKYVLFLCIRVYFL